MCNSWSFNKGDISSKMYPLFPYKQTSHCPGRFLLHWIKSFVLQQAAIEREDAKMTFDFQFETHRRKAADASFLNLNVIAKKVAFVFLAQIMLTPKFIT